MAKFGHGYYSLRGRSLPDPDWSTWFAIWQFLQQEDSANVIKYLDSIFLEKDSQKKYYLTMPQHLANALKSL